MIRQQLYLAAGANRFIACLLCSCCHASTARNASQSREPGCARKVEICREIRVARNLCAQLLAMNSRLLGLWYGLLTVPPSLRGQRSRAEGLRAQVARER